MNNRMMMDRYMRRPPTVVAPQPQARPAGQNPPKTLTTVLNEKLLRVIVRVEVLAYPRAPEAEKPAGEAKKRR